jgi:hypothetical protein
MGRGKRTGLREGNPPCEFNGYLTTRAGPAASTVKIAFVVPLCVLLLFELQFFRCKNLRNRGW